jgi:hypothetical protein
MRDLLIEYAGELMPAGDGGRFARLRAAKRGVVIDHLRVAREALSKQDQTDG